MKKILLIILFIGLASSGFYFVNEINYKKHIEIKENIVQHPEYIAEKSTARLTSFGLSSFRADLLWLETIQYIGGNVISADYKAYLYEMIDLITELNPYFEHPYIVGQLLLPSYNYRYEELSSDAQNEYINKAEKIGLKGVKNFCDADKIALIKNEYNLNKLWTEDKYKNPCSSYMVPYYLAYIYYFYKNDGEKASLYYKITSANENAMSGAKNMAAIMQGKGGNREKAIIMFLNLGKTVSTDPVCLQYSSLLEDLLFGVFNGKYKLDGDFLKKIEKDRLKINEALKSDEKTILDDTKCESYLNKSVREINLYYIEKGEKKFFEDKKEHSVSAKHLFDEGYLDYLPVDFQVKKDSEMIYYFNKKTGHYDYKFGAY